MFYHSLELYSISELYNSLVLYNDNSSQVQ